MCLLLHLCSYIWVCLTVMYRPQLFNYVYVGGGHMSTVLKEARKGCHVSWRCSYRQLWITQHRCWNLNSGPLKEQYILLNAEPLLQPIALPFRQRVTWTNVERHLSNLVVKCDFLPSFSGKLLSTLLEAYIICISIQFFLIYNLKIAISPWLWYLLQEEPEKSI